TVGKERDFVRLVPELQHKIIVADGPMGLQALSHFSEAERTLALVNLDGVASAERDVGVAFSRKMHEVVFAACTAIRAGMVGSNLGALVGPYVVGKQGSSDAIFG